MAAAEQQKFEEGQKDNTNGNARRDELDKEESSNFIASSAGREILGLQENC